MLLSNEHIEYAIVQYTRTPNRVHNKHIEHVSDEKEKKEGKKIAERKGS